MDKANHAVVVLEKYPVLLEDKTETCGFVAMVVFADSGKYRDLGAGFREVTHKLAPYFLSKARFDINADVFGRSVEGGRKADLPHALRD